jgi:hypothetical protein
MFHCYRINTAACSRNSMCPPFFARKMSKRYSVSLLCVLQHLRCNCFDRSKNSDLKFIEGGHRDLVNNVLNVSHRKKSSGVISGEPWGHGICPSLPTQRTSRNSRTIRAQRGGDVFAWNTTFCWSSNWGNRCDYNLEWHCTCCDCL